MASSSPGRGPKEVARRELRPALELGDILTGFLDTLDRISEILLRRVMIERPEFLRLIDGQPEHDVSEPDTPVRPTEPQLPARPQQRNPRLAPTPIPADPGLAG